MSRRIRAKKIRKTSVITFEQLQKMFPNSTLFVHTEEEGKNEPNRIAKCTYKNAKITDCIATFQYRSYNWGITSKGEAHFCCKEESFEEDDWNDGDKIMTEYKPTLEQLVKKRRK